MMKRRIGALALATSLLLAGVTAPAFADETSPDSPVGVTAGSGDDEVAESGATVERDGEGEATQSGEGAEPSADAEVPEVEGATAPAAPSVASATGDPEGTVSFLEFQPDNIFTNPRCPGCKEGVKFIPTVVDGKVTKWRAVVYPKTPYHESEAPWYTTILVGDDLDRLGLVSSEPPGENHETFDVPFGLAGQGHVLRNSPSSGAIGDCVVLTDSLPVFTMDECRGDTELGGHGFALGYKVDHTVVINHEVLHAGKWYMIRGTSVTCVADDTWRADWSYGVSKAIEVLNAGGSTSGMCSEPTGPSVEAHFMPGHGGGTTFGVDYVLLANWFQPGEEVTFEIQTDSGVLTLDTSATDSAGRTFEFRYGASLSPGEYRVVARGTISGEVTTVLTVPGPATDTDAPSTSAGPSVTVSAGSGEKVSSVVQGARVVLRAHGFRAGEEVTFEVHSDVVTLGTVRADAEGTATWEGALPASVLPGEHRVIARGAVSGEVSIPLTVTAPTAAAGGLADTGVSAATAPAGAMAVLLALGGCAGLVARRRLLG